jgi:sec-independent protein translocase protein TatA
MSSLSIPNVLASQVLGFIGNFGMMEWAVILVIALLLFGRRLPEVGKSLGTGIREFKKGLKETEEDARRDVSRESSSSNQRGSLPQHDDLNSRAANVTDSTRERSEQH